MRYLLIIVLLAITIATSYARQNQVIVFSSDRNGDFEIYRLRPDGSELKQLTDNDTDDKYPVLSPQGLVAFVAINNGKSDICTMDLEGGNRRCLTTVGNNRSPAFSPDGSYLLFISDRDGDFEIYRMALDGSGQEKITDNQIDDRAPSFSPDGNQIIFVSQWDDHHGIYVMNADGGKARQLFNQGDSWAPIFSPDGDSIAFYSNAQGEYEVYVMRADGSEVRRLTDDNGASHPSFSPDGTSLVYSSYQDDQPQLYLLDMHTSLTRKISTAQINGTAPRWSSYAAF